MTTTAIRTTGIEGPQGPQGLSLRGKHFRVVSEERKTEEQDFRFTQKMERELTPLFYSPHFSCGL